MMFCLAAQAMTPSKAARVMTLLLVAVAMMYFGEGLTLIPSISTARLVTM